MGLGKLFKEELEKVLTRPQGYALVNHTDGVSRRMRRRLATSASTCRLSRAPVQRVLWLFRSTRCGSLLSCAMPRGVQ
jgi:hypothetical protein